jgi:hypothetical protein
MGDLHEGLPEQTAQDLDPGAVRQLTPRPLIQGIADCIAPRPREAVHAAVIA